MGDNVTFRRDAVDPKYALLAKFFMDMGNRTREDQATAAANAEARSRLDYASQKDREKFDYEKSKKDEMLKAIADAIRMSYPENRPDVETESTLPTQQLGDLSGMAGVAGQMSPEDAVNRAIAGPPQGPAPTQAGPDMTGMIGETRKMTSEEVLPEMFARLLQNGASTEDIKNLQTTLLGRQDYNVARGGGLGGEATPSPFQTLSAEAADADVNYKNAQSINLLASAGEKQAPSYDYSEEEISATALGLARGDYKSWGEALSGRDPKLRPMVKAYMDARGMRFITPENRKQMSATQQAEDIINQFGAMWEDIESTESKLEKAKKIVNFRQVVEGMTPMFRGAVGEAGAFTDKDRTAMMNLFNPGTISTWLDAYMNGTSPLPEVQDRLNTTKSIFETRVKGHFGGYYKTWKEMQSGSMSSEQTSNPAPGEATNDPLGIL